MEQTCLIRLAAVLPSPTPRPSDMEQLAREGSYHGGTAGLDWSLGAELAGGQHAHAGEQTAGGEPAGLREVGRRGPAAPAVVVELQADSSLHP